MTKFRKTKMRNRDDAVLRYLYKEGFQISSQDLDETRLDRDDSKITVVVKGERD
jgi:site-specific recombinase XerC